MWYLYALRNNNAKETSLKGVKKLMVRSHKSKAPFFHLVQPPFPTYRTGWDPGACEKVAAEQDENIWWFGELI